LISASVGHPAFAKPLVVGGEEMITGASVGMAAAGPAGLTTPEQLLHEADTAMYRAKDGGRGRFELFDDIMRFEVEDRVELARELHHPDRGIVPPKSFIPLAEENGLILPIADWVLEQACRQGAEWRRAGHDLTVSVNVSPNQLAQPDFAGRVDEIVHASGLPAQCLCLELVESTVARQPDRIGDALRDLGSHGVRIALDDFGMGATSLAHFCSLPLDVVKLDRSFVSGLRSGGGARAIVTALVTLASELGMTVVAEGVEAEDQVSELRELGCELVPGYWFGRPADPSSLALEGFSADVRPGLGDPFVIREFMRQIGIPARIR
jgi:EAL domain-containing protein (putative c-di-GMP-specific phosphodiesterase class I)